MVGERGFTLHEVAVAVVVVAILASIAFTGTPRELRAVGRAFEETKAGRLASGRIESLRANKRSVVPGERTFPIPATASRGLPEALGREVVRAVEPGLFEVTVEVSWRSTGSARRRRAVLATRIDKEARR